MKNFFLALFLAMLTSAAQADDKKEAPKPNAASAAAIVNGEKISMDELLQYVTEFKKQSDDSSKISDDKIFEVFREDLIRMILIKMAASAAKVESDPEYQKKMKELEDGLKIKTFLAQKQKEWDAAIAEKDLAKEVEQLEKTEKSLVFQQMSVPENVAERVKKALESGQNFVKVAQAYALDKKQKFDMDPLPEASLASLPAQMRQVFANLKPGGVVLIPGKGSITVMKLVSRQPLQDKKILMQIAKQKILSAKSEAFLKELSEKAKIERFDINGKPVKAPALEAVDTTNASKEKAEPAKEPAKTGA